MEIQSTTYVERFAASAYLAAGEYPDLVQPKNLPRAGSYAPVFANLLWIRINSTEWTPLGDITGAVRLKDGTVSPTLERLFTVFEGDGSYRPGMEVFADLVAELQKNRPA